MDKTGGERGSICLFDVQEPLCAPYVAHPNIQELNTGQMLEISAVGNGFAELDHSDLSTLSRSQEIEFFFVSYNIVPVSGLCKASSISIYVIFFSLRFAKPLLSLVVLSLSLVLFRLSLPVTLVLIPIGRPQTQNLGHVEKDVGVLHDPSEDGDGLGLALGKDRNVLQRMDTLSLVGGDGPVGQVPIGLVGRVGVGGPVDGDGRETRTVLGDRVGFLDIGVSTESGSDGVSGVPLDGEVGSLYSSASVSAIGSTRARPLAIAWHSRSPKTMLWLLGWEPLATWYSE